MAFVRRVHVSFVDDAHDLEIVLADEATVADLGDVLGLDGELLMLDGSMLDPAELVTSTGVVDGSVLSVVEQSSTPESNGLIPVARIDHVAGFPTGFSQALYPGTNGFEVGGAVATLSVQEDAVLARPKKGELVVGNRAVREELPIGNEIVSFGGALHLLSPDVTRNVKLTEARPANAPLSYTRKPFAWKVPFFLAVIAAALIVGGVFGPSFLIAAGIVCATAAVLALGKELNDRRKANVKDDFSAGQHRTQFARELQGQAVNEAARWRSAWPTIPALYRTYSQDAPAVSSPGRAGEVVLGYGTAPWTPAVESHGKLDPVLVEEISRSSVLSNVPISGSLGSSSIGILATDIDMAVATARALVVQAIGLYPDDVAVAARLDADGFARWDWLKWSTHLVDDELHLASAGQPATAHGASDAPLAGTLIVIDADDALAAAVGLSADFAQGISPSSGAYGPIVVCRTEAMLRRCDLQMSIAANGHATLNRSGAVSPMSLIPHTVSVQGAAAVVRAMRSGDLIEMGEQPPELRAGVRPYLLLDRVQKQPI